MPTSRLTSSIFLRSSVNSMPSTTTRPRCQLSIRLMQRKSVDLPLPDGPQMTMRSPRITLRSTSRSTWNSPNHLLKPTISTATGFRVVRMSGAPSRGFAPRSTSLMNPAGPAGSIRSAGIEPPLREQRIARHSETDEKIDHSGESEAGEKCHGRRPVRVGKGGTQLAEQIEDRDDQHQRCILEQRDERIDDAGNDELERLRQDDETHHAPIAEPERANNAGERDDERDEQPAPDSGLDMLQSEHAADQQEEAGDRKDAEEQDRVQPLVGNARDEQRHQQEHAERIGEIDAPLLVLRVEAIHELAELGGDERPAGADLALHRLRQAVDATRSLPDRIDEQKFHRRPRDRSDDDEADDCQRGIEHTVEQALLNQSERARTRGRRRLGFRQRAADIARLRVHGHQRSATRIWALYQFIRPL